MWEHSYVFFLLQMKKSIYLMELCLLLVKNLQFVKGLYSLLIAEEDSLQVSANILVVHFLPIAAAKATAVGFPFPFAAQ